MSQGGMKMAYKGVDRRKGPDLVVKTFHYMSNSTMLINVILIFMLGFAKPRNNTMFDKFAGAQVAGQWDQDKLFLVLILLMIQLIISSVGLLLNATRHHRKKDKYSGALLFSLFISIFGFLFMILK